MLLRILVLVALAGCSSAGGRAAEPVAQDDWAFPLPDDAFACTVDDDCVKISRDCCGCTAGGTAGAVSKRHLEAVQQSSRDTCGEMACPTVMSSDVSCIGTVAACVDGSCGLVPNR